MNLCLIACSLVVRTIFVTWAKGEEDEHFARLDNVPIKSFPVVYEPENPKGLSNYTAIMSEQVDFVGIRIRLNPPVFEETARLFCFKISGFQKPRAITLKPFSPNLLMLNIFSFDLDIIGILNGQINVLWTGVPVSGNFVASARQLSIAALFDLQKNQFRVPFLRMPSCELRSGFVTTQITNMGLLTDSINLKYKAEIVTKAKEIITSTICQSIDSTMKTRINERLKMLPRSLSVTKILRTFVPDEQSPVPSCLGVPDQQPKFRLPRSIANGTRNLNEANQKSVSGDDFVMATVSEIIPAGNNSTSRAGNSSELIKYLDVKSDNNITSPWNSNQTNSRENLTIIQAGNRRTPATVLKTDVFKLWRGKNDLEPLGGGGTLNSIELPILGVGGQKLYTPVENQKSKESHSTLDDGLAGCSGGGNLATLLDLLDTNLMNNIFINLDFLDSSAGSNFFAVGLSGDVFLQVPRWFGEPSPTFAWKTVVDVNNSKKSGNSATAVVTKSKNRGGSLLDDENRSLSADNDASSKEQKRSAVHFPISDSKLRMPIEIVISEDISNMVLLQAHRAKLLKVRVGADSAIFGPLLKTSCSPDEVCLSDSVSEAGEKYPNQQFELEVEPVQPPKLKIGKNMVSLRVIGTAVFYLYRTRRTVGKIPFSTTVEIHLKTVSFDDGRANNNSVSGSGTKYREALGVKSIPHKKANKIEVSIAIPKLEILEDVDFFELSAETLTGFRDAVRGAIVNEAARLFISGVDLSSFEMRMKPYGLSQFGIQLSSDGLVLLNADVDVKKLIFDGDMHGG